MRLRALFSGATLLLVPVVVGAGSSAAQDVPPAARSVTIYSSLPLQGDSRPQSVDIMRAMRMALEANQGMAGSFAVRFVSLDDASKKSGFPDPARAAANARRAAKDPSTVAYLGEFNSFMSMTSIPITNRAGILQVSPSNTYVGLTRSLGAQKGEPGMYYPTGGRTYGRVVPADHIQAAALVSLMRAKHCAKTYILHAPEPYGEGIAHQVRRVANAHGVKTAGHGAIDPEVDGFRGPARRVKRSGADCFFFGGITQFRAVDVFKAVAAARPGIWMFGPDGVAETAFTSELGRIQKRVLITNPTLARRFYPAAGQKFFADFKAKYGRYPEPYAIYGYDTMSLALDAIARGGERAGPSADGRMAIVDAFFATRDRESVLGNYDIDRNGDTTLTAYGVFKVRHGLVVFDRVIKAVTRRR